MDMLRGGFMPGLQGNGAGLIADTPSSYDPTSEAIFAAFTTQPSIARKGLIDNCVVSLKAAGVWNKLDALYAFAAADRQAAIINWKNPGTYNATEVSAPTFTADQGFTGNGTTSYVDTGFNPSLGGSNFVQNSASIFAWSLTDTSVAAPILGMATQASGESLIFPRSSGNTLVLINQASSSSWANSDGSGFFDVTRRASTAIEGYRNTTSLGTGSLTSVAPLNANFTFLRRGATYWAGQCAAGGLASQFSAADNTALYNALRTYMTGVGVP